MKAFIVILLTLMLTVNCAVSGDLQKYALETAHSLVGTTEKTGNNDGPIIKEILGNIGLKEGQPYCCATVVYCYEKGSKKLGIKNPLPKYGRVSSLYSYASTNPFKYKIIKSNSLKLKTEKLQEGDIAIWSRSPTEISNFNGHTGIVDCHIEYEYHDTAEGNTGGSKDQGEGDGIWIKKRYTFKQNGNLKLKGYIRIK